MFRLLQSQLDPQHKQRTKLLEIGVYLQKNRRTVPFAQEIAQKTLIPSRLSRSTGSGDLEALPRTDLCSLVNQTICRKSVPGW
jgi:hypothetical protein